MPRLWDVPLRLFANLWQFALAHPEIAISIAGAASGFIVWLAPKMSRLWKARERRNRAAAIESTSPFEVMLPHSNDVVQRIYDSKQAVEDPLADFNIPYQIRREGFRQELEQALIEHRWLLVLGRTGLGKTREAAELAKTLNHEGWTILKLKNSEWLEVPTQLEAKQFGSQPKLLFVLDNLNQAMILSKQSSFCNVGNNDEMATTSVARPSLQERLLETLQFYEAVCGLDRVRVIATARNEQEKEPNANLSEWEKLEIEKHPTFWNRFKHYQLSAPDDEAVAQVLQETTANADIRANASSFNQIARENDRTFRNVVENLARLKNRGLELNTETYISTLKGTWESRYEAATQKHPKARYLYDAIDLLRQVNMQLMEITVVPTAVMLMGGNAVHRLLHRWQLQTVLKDLQQTENILNPRDGQIEAKPTPPIDVGCHIPGLTNLLIRLCKKHTQSILTSLIGLGLAASETKHHTQSINLLDIYLSFSPKHDLKWLIYSFKGVTLGELGRYEEALAAFDQALATKPGHHKALHHTLYFKGVALFMLGCYEEAVAAYNQALDIRPDLHEVFYYKGMALFILGRYEEAIAACDQALAIKPDCCEVLRHKGISLFFLDRYGEAVAVYNQALDIKPDLYEVFYYKGMALFILDRYEEAVAAYDKALFIKSDLHEVLYYKGLTLRKLGRYEEAIAAYDQALAIQPDLHEALYNKARCYGLQGKVEPAIEALSRAIELNSKYREMAKTDSDFDAIREDARFQALLIDSAQNSD